MKSRRMIYSILATFAALSFISSSAQALPSVSDASVSFGSVTFTSSGNDITITQASNASIINWSSFALNSGESLTFQQQTSSDTTLLRITGSNPLVFSGTLTSIGGIFLVAEDGLAGNMVINASKLWISNANISNDDFINGNYGYPINTGLNIIAGGVGSGGGGSAIRGNGSSGGGSLDLAGGGGSVGGNLDLVGGGGSGGSIGSGTGGIVVIGGGNLVLTGAGGSGGGTNISVLSVAEPETYALLMSGLALLGAVANRNKKTRFAA